MSITISHTTISYPSLPYLKIKNAILGANHELSIVFIGTQRARTLNQKHRNKSSVPDVLSFPLSKNVGEVFLCLPQIFQTAHRFDHTPKQHTGYLFIHGLLHLKGYDHGATMEQAERRFLNRYIFNNSV